MNASKDRETQDDNSVTKVLNMVAKLSKIRYTNTPLVCRQVQEELHRLFENNIHFDTLTLNSSEQPSIMVFKKIVIRTPDTIEIFCKHNTFRKVLKSLAGTVDVPNMKDFDVLTLMKQKPALILIYGTSGSGKSTMSRRLAKMYGIKNILSTDTVRKQMRETVSKEENPLLHASTFETGDFLSAADYQRIKDWFKANQADPRNTKIDPEIIQEMACVRGYEYQCEMVAPHLIAEIDRILATGESLVVEGVHLSEEVCNTLFAKYEFCIPFLIYVKDAEHHKARFGSRCDGGSIDPSKNRYVKNFRYIRAIQRAIKQIPIESKFIKLDNDDALKTLSLVATCVRKYTKKIMNLSYKQLKTLMVDRKSNILNDVYKQSCIQMSKDKKIPKENAENSSSMKNINTLLCKKNKHDNGYWFLPHEKLFHIRTKKYSLVKEENKKRARSARKKNKYQDTSLLSAIEAYTLKKKLKCYRKQKSIFEAVRKYGKMTAKSKASESTACTITKVNACC